MSILLMAWRAPILGWIRRVYFAGCCLFSACSLSPPPGIVPVQPFDVSRYTGTWYEIARLDHRFEAGLTHIEASYALSEDGSVRVVNRGREVESGVFREAVGRAIFLGPRDQGSLKVSFFGPFYGGYHIADLDREGYQWSLVVGPSRDYFWILSRTPKMDRNLLQDLVQRARKLGIDTNSLIYTPQDPPR